jgi:nitrate reductase NapD
MNIAGVLVHAHPKQVAQVKKQLLEMPGVEVHVVTDDGRLIVTVEQDDDHRMADTMLNLHHCEGVLSAAMVYQYGDDDTDKQENTR